MLEGVETMARIELYPELRTTGGEALSIHREGEWIGDVYLIYRENDLLTGTIHLDDEYVKKVEAYRIIQEVQSYITSLSYALNVTDHNINILYGEYSLLEDYVDSLEDEEDGDDLVEEVKGYERWIVGQGKQGIEYQVYNDEGDLVAEAVVDIKGTRIVGDIHFTSEPTEQEMEDVEAILLKDYDHDLIDQYNFTFFVNGEEYEEVEIETEDDEMDDWEEAEVDSDSDIVQLLERQEEEDDYEERERAEVIFDLVDPKDRPLGEATFIYSEDGVDVNVELAIKPTEDTAHHIMKSVFEEALTDPMEWVNIRMNYKGQVVDGFHFERGKESSIEV